MDKIPISLVNSNLQNVDSLISAVSFEKRCLVIPMAFQNSIIKNRILCYNANETGILAENVANLIQVMGQPIELLFDSENPLLIAESLYNFFVSKADFELGNLLVDITTFTHEGLLILFKYLQIYNSKYTKLTVIYVGAYKYSVNEIDSTDKWLTKGIKNIRSVLGFPGILKPYQKNHLVILFGFESDRTKKLIDEFDFDKISIGFGSSEDSITDEHYQLNLSRHTDLLNQYPSAEKFVFSVTNPQEAKVNILSQCEKFPEYNVVVAPMNTKLSTLGAALAVFERSEIQLCYVQASQYNISGYSEASDTCLVGDFLL